MDTYSRLPGNVEYHLERARELRRAYLGDLLRRGHVAMSAWMGRIFRIAGHPHNSAAH